MRVQCKAMRSIGNLPHPLDGMVMGHFRILGIGLELACNGGLCWGISLKREYESGLLLRVSHALKRRFP